MTTSISTGVGVSNRCWRVVLFIAFLVLDIRASMGTETTLAILLSKAGGLNQSPVVELLQVSLSTLPGVALLERSEVDRILQEQSLQLAFAPEGGATRRSLGALLKADLLIILNAGQKNGIPSLDLVIGETSSGLRLSKSSFFLNAEQPQETVDGIMEEISKALKKREHPVKLVVAVSPFISEDLAQTYDDLQRIYGGIVENSVQDIEGVQLVEITEGQAIAKELALTGGAPVSRAQLPVYFFGSYRNEGQNDDRRVILKLEIKQGETSLASRNSEPFPPTQAAEFLGKSALDLLASNISGATYTFDPLTEARALNARSAEFEKIGEIGEALNLIEASLLVLPAQKLLHCHAFSLCQRMSSEYAEGRLAMADKLASGRRAMEYSMRSLDHLEVALYALFPGEYKHIDGEYDLQLSNPLSGFTGSYNFVSPPPEIIEAISKYDRRVENILLSYYENLLARGILTRRTMDNLGLRYGPFISAEAKMRLLHLLGAQPYSLNDMYEIIRDCARKGDKTPSDDKFLELVKADPMPLIQLAYELFFILDEKSEVENRVERLQKAKAAMEQLKTDSIPNLPGDVQRLLAKFQTPDSTPTATLPPPTIPEPTVTPTIGVNLPPSIANVLAGASSTITAPTGPRPATIFTFHKKTMEVVFKPIMNLIPPILRGGQVDDWEQRIDGCVKTVEGVDAIVQMRALYLSREKGKLEPVLYLEDNEGTLGMVLWDGLHLWAAIQNANPRILILDPVTGEMDFITKEDGLPPVVEGALGLVLEQGKVFIAACALRSWVGILTYQGPGQKTVEVIHEFRNTNGSPSDVDAAFVPEGFQILEGEGTPGGAKRISINRRIIDPAHPNIWSGDRPQPVVVDLTTKNVSLGPPAPSSKDKEGLQYGLFYVPATGDRETLRAALAQIPEVKKPNEEFNLRLQVNGKTYAIGLEEVWLFLGENPFTGARKLESNLPKPSNKSDFHQRSIFYSHLYGTLYQIDGAIYQVSIKS